MDFTGRPMRGMLTISSESVANDIRLRQWLSWCREFVETLPANDVAGINQPAALSSTNASYCPTMSNREGFVSSLALRTRGYVLSV